MEVFWEGACQLRETSEVDVGREGPTPFGSRYEIFEGTTNNVADSTRPAIWLGSDRISSEYMIRSIQ
jgi:hypothetical protein